MKRTVTLTVEVPDNDEYAVFVADLMNHRAVVDISMTGGDQIQKILREDHQLETTQRSGSVTDGFGLRGSK